jgi:hypothetical protein
MNAENTEITEADTAQTDQVAALPDAGTEQIADMERAVHGQTVLLEHESGSFEVRWDGKTFRLLRPAGVDTTSNSIAYTILGHLEADLPFPLELPTLERHARIVVYAYLNPDAPEG